MERYSLLFPLATQCTARVMLLHRPIEARQRGFIAGPASAQASSRALPTVRWIHLRLEADSGVLGSGGACCSIQLLHLAHCV